MGTGFLLGVIASLIAWLISKAADNKVTALYEAIRKKPFETFTVITLCIVVVGVVKLAFLQG